MGMFLGIDAAASGLTAERLRMDVISNNIANANTTRAQGGGAYHRRYVVFQPREKGNGIGFEQFAEMKRRGQLHLVIAHARSAVPRTGEGGRGHGALGPAAM